MNRAFRCSCSSLLALSISLFSVAQTTHEFPIFGPDYQKVTVKDSLLSGVVFYVVSGHGGPDPGAVAEVEGHSLCEDEYAYDISLRLARNLLEHDAAAYMIVRDENDGIRSEKYLECDKDETCWENQEIPREQIPRLDQRATAINQLYKVRGAAGAKDQLAIIIHVDSRSSKQGVDVFFYHDSRSKRGKKLAQIMQNTLDEKYAQHQKGRGYAGTVKARDLHMLRETAPTAVYIELGNLNNVRDQKRFLLESNRQAVADWLTEGVLKFVEG